MIGCRVAHMVMIVWLYQIFFNPLPLLFKALLHGQKDRVFFSGHLNLRTTPETGLPSRKKNHNNSYYTRNRSPLQEKKS